MASPLSPISIYPKIQSLKSYIEKARQGEARRARRACMYMPHYMLGNHPNTSGVQFLTFFFVLYEPHPQPSNEIRKPNIELKFTLISVTICSLIFFICTSSDSPGQEDVLIAGKPCGVLGHVRCLHCPMGLQGGTIAPT